MEEEFYNVVFTLKDWVYETDLNNSQLTALAFDLFDATAVTNMFDAFATRATGIYKHTPFMTTSWPVKDIRAAIQYVAELPSPKVLYGFQEINDSDMFMIDQDVPAKYIIRYAVIPVDDQQM